MDFYNIEDLIKYVNQQMIETLEKDVAPVVIELEREHIRKDVYNFYPDPKIYKRTFQLINNDNFKVKVDNINNGVIITNETIHDNKYIPEIVETGKGYDYTGYGYAYEEPRPFTENTEKELLITELHEKIFIKRMKSKGFDIK